MARSAVKKHRLQVLPESDKQDGVTLACFKCRSTLTVEREALRLLLTEHDQRLVNSSLGKWSRCTGKDHS